eukprot:jgi/Chlat1/5428/Chrsp35S08992
MALSTAAAVSAPKTSFLGSELKETRRARAAAPVCAAKRSTVCHIEEDSISRRAALGLVATTLAAATLADKPALAAYGERANVFGSATPNTGFRVFKGAGFTVAVPAKWNTSKEQDFPNTQARFEDNFDAVSNMVVTKTPTTKSSVTDYGSPETFLDQISFFLGQQVYSGETRSEGGFASGKVAKTALLDVNTTKDRNGTTYYKYEMLTTTADGDEGGRHQLINAAVKDGNLYVLKIQAGDKRWFKGTDRAVRPVFDSFTIA